MKTLHPHLKFGISLLASTFIVACGEKSTKNYYQVEPEQENRPVTEDPETTKNPQPENHEDSTPPIAYKTSDIPAFKNCQQTTKLSDGLEVSIRPAKITAGEKVEVHLKSEKNIVAYDGNIEIDGRRFFVSPGSHSIMEFETSPFALSGVYRLTRLNVQTKSEDDSISSKAYESPNIVVTPENPLPDLCFYVENTETEDKVAPELMSVSFPENISLTAEDFEAGFVTLPDLSGLSQVYFNTKDSQGKSYFWSGGNFKTLDGVSYLTFSRWQDLKVGQLTVSEITVKDRAGNQRTYSRFAEPIVIEIVE